MLTDNGDAPLILIVEDDNNHAELIQRSFEESQEEYRLEIVGTICDAKTASERLSPSLVLTDYRLPDGDGSQLVVLAAGAWPVVMMTSHGSEQVAVEAMKIGAQDYIVKSPETFERLANTVKYALMSWSLIIARKQVGEAVFNAKKDWERTFDAVPDLISIIDLSHTVIRVNKAMADRCGFKPDELIGRKCYDMIDGKSSSHSNCPHAKIILNGQVYNTKVEEKRLNGHFDVTVSPLFDGENQITAYVHVMRDITEWKLAEEERQALEKQFQQTQKLESLGVLAGGIAHDFNNILTIILGHCYMFKENIDPGMTDKARVEQIEGAANRAADLCRQMLAYAGNSPLHNVQIHLWLLVDEMVKMLQAAIKKNVTIKLDLKRDVPEISGDSAQIQQVVMNLIINAAEAIGDNNGTIEVCLKKTSIQADQSDTDFVGKKILSGDYACLEVCDDGCGMDENVVKRIFEPFYTTKFTGRGLGMSAILGIIKSHNGSLQLSSKPGAGTTFKIYFPLPVKAAAVRKEQMLLPVLSANKNGTILLVDDEEVIRTVGTALMNAMGFNIMTAANGSEALKLYKDCFNEIDLVMLDLIMPEMGGVEAYHELRKLDKDLPVVICSGYGAKSVADITATDDNACFLHKPYNSAELSKVLNDKIIAKV